MAVEIPEKLFYKIGEVAALLNVKTHVLRYWESEFPMLRPVKSRTNQRLYRREDVQTALLIKDLLYQQGFTIAGARKQLTAEPRSQRQAELWQRSPAEILDQVKRDLHSLQQRLAQDKSVD